LRLADFNCPQRGQVLGHELAVEQFRAAAPQRRHQPGQRNLRSVGDPAEHRFAAEHPVETHAVKSANQLAVLPALDRMGQAKQVEDPVARLDPVADPGFLRFAARRGAGLHHPVEAGVAGHGKASAPQGAGQRARTAEAIERQDRAAARLDPEDFRIVPRIGHRENPVAIGQHQQVGLDRGMGHRCVHGATIAECARQEDKFLAIRLSLT
jgi:hypothetical protein